MRASPSKVILVAGIVAGALDLTAACITNWLRAGTTPERVMQSVASGLLGAASYDGGAGTAVLGTVLHFCIATGWAAIFYLLSRKLPVLVKQPVTFGLLYGVVVYLIMNFVVLPLSAFPKRAAPPLSARIVGLLVIMFCIGLPIALIVRRLSGWEPDSASL